MRHSPHTKVKDGAHGAHIHVKSHGHGSTLPQSSKIPLIPSERVQRKSGGRSSSVRERTHKEGSGNHCKVVHAEYDYRGHYIEPEHTTREDDSPEEKEIHEYLQSRQKCTFIREHVLKTGAMGHSDKSVHHWAPVKPRLLLFVSSTFTDTGLERNLLQEDVVPRLRDMARSHGIEISLFDLRWGVRDENTLDHRTWEACYHEIKNCAEKSIGSFFLSLQGDKYGYCPLPRTIDKKLFDDRMATVDDEALQSLARQWYFLDANALPWPGTYVLKPLERLDDASFWEEALPLLRKALKGLSFWPQNENIVVGNSVSEYEFLEAERLGIERCYWIKRNIHGGKDADTDPWQLYSEWNSPSSNLLQSNLIATMISSFGTAPNDDAKFVRSIDVNSDDLIMRTFQDGDATIDINYSHESYSSAVLKEETRRYCDRWKGTAFVLLQKEVNRCVAVSDAWENNGEGLGLSGAVLQELLHHYVWGYQKLSLFSGREELIARALEIISAHESTEDRGDTPSAGIFAGITLVVYGKSGAGKTAFCSKLADTLRVAEEAARRENEDTYEPRPVLLRFCGTSPGSGTGTMLLLNLCRQIHYILDKNEDDIPQTYSGRVRHFHGLLASHAMIVVIDSLDQLSNDDEARSNLTFLRNIKPHPRTLIIVSTIPDDRESGYLFGCSSRLSESNVPSIVVPISAEGAELFLLNFLEKRYQRKLTDNQMECVLEASQQEPSALWFTLAARIASTWTSSMPIFHNDVHPHGCRIAAGVKPLLDQIFDQISKDFGQELSRLALTLLTIARNGIKSTEMEDLLSLDDTVLDDIFQYSKPNMRRIPVHVWLRLKNHLESLIVEVSDGCVTWYHRQLHEAAQTRFIDFERGKYAKRAHLVMAKYFSNRVSKNDQKARNIAEHPRALKGDVWFSHDTTINARRVQEAAHSYARYLDLVKDNASLKEFVVLTDEAVEEICSLESVCCSHRMGEGMRLPSILQSLKESVAFRIRKQMKEEDPEDEGAYEPSPELQQMRQSLRVLCDYWRWVLRDSTTLHNATEDHVPALITATASCQPSMSQVRIDLDILRKETYPSNATVSDMRVGGGELWLRASSLGIEDEYNELLMAMRGHSDALNTVVISSDGLFAISCGNDSLIKRWDLRNGECVGTLQGHTGHVTSIAVNHDAHLLLSGGGQDQECRLWDVRSGVCIEQWACGIDLNAVAMTGDDLHAAIGLSGRIVVAGEDKNIQVYRRNSSKVDSTLVGHTAAVNALALSTCGSLCASASDDHTARVWNLGAGTCLSILKGHNHHVTACAISSDMTCCLTGGDDKLLKVYDIKDALAGTNEHLGHCRHSVECNGPVKGIAVAADNDKVVVATQNRVLEVWGLRAGDKLNSLVGHSGSVSGVCMTGEGHTVISCSHDRSVCVWDVSVELRSEKMGQSFKKGKKYHGHSGAMTAVACHASSALLVSACEDHSIKLWDVEDGTFRGEIRGYPALVLCLRISQDGRQLLAGARDNLVKVWSLAGLNEGRTEFCSRDSLIRDLTGHTDWVTDVDLSGEVDGNRIVASCSNDHTARLFSFDTGECLHVLQSHTGGLSSLNFSQDGTLLITGSSDRTAILWSTQTGKLLHAFAGHTNRLNAVAICGDDDDSSAGDNIVVTGSADGEIRLWSTKGEALDTLAHGLGEVSSICVSCTDTKNTIIVTVNMRFCVFDVQRRLCVFSSLDLAGHIRAAAVTDCGKRVISGDSSNNVKVWDMAHRPRERKRRKSILLGQ